MQNDSKALAVSVPTATDSGDALQNGTQRIVNHSKKLQDDMQEIGKKIKHYEDNINFLKSLKNQLDGSILDLQVAIGKFHTSSSSKEECDNATHVNSKNETIKNILKYKNSAAALFCKMSSEAKVSDHVFVKDFVGIVATLGKVQDANLSRLLSKYLGLETMLAVVCKSREGVKSMESYARDGSIDKNTGIHAYAASFGSPLDSSFGVICIEDLIPYHGQLVANDPQRTLDLLKPRLVNGETPPGFLGFAVNMILIDNSDLYSASNSGHSLRETLFYNLLKNLQVYKTREDMYKALPLLAHGAISLDGGIIRSPSCYLLGHNQGDIGVKFPCESKSLSFPEQYYQIENQLKEAKWKKDQASEDMDREKHLLEQAKLSFETKKRAFVRFLSESSFATQTARASTPI